MDARSERIEQLRGLVATDGLELADDDRSIQVLNDWFRARVELKKDEPDRLRPLWYAVVLDTALFLGDAMIRRDPQLHWDYFVADKRDIGYQKPVIMGFTDAPKDYYVDIDRLVVTEAHCIIAGDLVRRDAAGASCTGSADADHTPSRV